MQAYTERRLSLASCAISCLLSASHALHSHTMPLTDMLYSFLNVQDADVDAAEEA